ncbi:MAG TPA: hypothetical protein PKH07_17535, partial [bacterium]|nr:hypothetical protein [bacterium]
VEKPGYDYRYYPNEDRFSYRKGFIPIHVPDESNPVMFKIRKRATKPTFLLYSPYVRLDFNDSSGNEYGHDVLRADMGNSEMRDGWFDDFRVVANRTESATEAVLVFSAGGEDAGFVASSEFLGMAPESGYSGEYVLCVKDGVDPQERYLYLRSRQPLLYSVAELHGVRVGRRGVFVQIRLRTNPLGDRNLEMDEQFPIAARHHIQAKVREAYRDGVPLDVTPLKELIEVARGTTEAESHRIADQVDELVKKVEREERRNFEIDTATLTEMYRKAKKIKD